MESEKQTALGSKHFIAEGCTHDLRRKEELVEIRKQQQEPLMICGAAMGIRISQKSPLGFLAGDILFETATAINSPPIYNIYIYSYILI